METRNITVGERIYKVTKDDKGRITTVVDAKGEFPCDDKWIPDVLEIIAGEDNRMGADGDAVLTVDFVYGQLYTEHLIGKLTGVVERLIKEYTSLHDHVFDLEEHILKLENRLKAAGVISK